jgi:hypothetical protein
VIFIEKITYKKIKNNMKANMLDYMYEGYGYDMDNQLLYTDVEKYNEALTSGSSMSTNGMETLAHQGIISHDPAIPTEEDNKYIETVSFISESGAKYTDLREGICGCGRETGAGETVDNGD